MSAFRRAPFRALPTRDRARASAAVAALVVAMGLAGCDNQYQETLQVASSSEGANSLNTQILIRNAHLAVPEDPEQLLYPVGSSAPLLVNLVNNTPQRDRLVAVSTPGAESVGVTSGSGTTSGVDIDLPAASDVALTEGLSLSLQGLTRPLGPGSVVAMTFEFERAEPVDLNVPVATPDGREEREPENVHGGEEHEG